MIEILRVLPWRWRFLSRMPCPRTTRKDEARQGLYCAMQPIDKNDFANMIFRTRVLAALLMGTSFSHTLEDDFL